MRFWYKPYGIALGVIGGRLAAAAFRRVWGRMGADGELHPATDRSYGHAEVILGAAVHGAVVAGIKAFVDRFGSAGYERASGVWPGKRSGG